MFDSNPKKKKNPPDPNQPRTVPNFVHSMEDSDYHQASTTHKISTHKISTHPPILSTPWRKGMEWGDKAYKDLKAEIQTYKLCKDAGIDEINVLLVGEISAGKSSFFNSVESVFKEHVRARANAGVGERSVTKQYRQYRVKAKDRKNQTIKFNFCDSMGLEADDTKGLSPTDIGKIMDGHVKEKFELSRGIQQNMLGYNKNPTENDKIHCVAFVVNAKKFAFIDERIVKKIRDIREEANGRDMNPIVILTHTDEYCSITKKDTSKVFLSSAIEAKVFDVSERFGIPQSLIYPVRNYDRQTECEQDIDILILRALRQIVRNSEAFLEDKIELREAEDKYTDETIAERKSRKKKEVDNSSDEDSGSDEQDARNQEISAQKNSLTDYPDTDYLPSKSRDTASGSKPLPSILKTNKVPPSLLANQRTGIFKQDFYGDRDDGEIDVKEGDEVTELKPNEDGWTVVRANGKNGKVPTEYIEWSAVKGPKQPPKLAPTPSKATKVPPPRNANQRKGIFQEDFFGVRDDGEIDLREGEVVTEIMPDKDGWTVVRANGETGKVPTGYIEWSPGKGPKPAPMRSKRVKKLFALEAYNADDNSQVDLYEGEEVTEIQPDDGDWTIVRNENWEEGYVPTNCLGGPPKKVHPTKKIPRKANQVPDSSPPPSSCHKMSTKPDPPPSSKKPSKMKNTLQPCQSSLAESPASTSTQHASPPQGQPPVPPPLPPPTPIRPQPASSLKPVTKNNTEQNSSSSGPGMMGDLKDRLNKRRSVMAEPDLSSIIQCTPDADSNSHWDPDSE